MHETAKESLKYRLHATMTSRFVRTKHAWSWVLYVSLGILGLSLASAIVVVPGASAAIDFFSVVFGVVLFLLRRHAQGLYAEAEELRRAHRQLDSHGVRPRDAVVLDMPASVEGLDLGPVSPERTYYGAMAEPGPSRVADNLVESAFYTRALARRTWKVCAASSLLGLFLVLGLLWYGSTMGAGGAILSRLVPHVFSFLVLGFTADLGLSFHRLSEVASETVTRLEAIRTNERLRLEDLLPALTDYDCALAFTGAPIPDRVYASMQSELNSQWEAYLKMTASRNIPMPTPPTRDSSASTILSTKRIALRDLLFTVFDDEELRRFVGDLNDPELRACVPGPAASFASAVDALIGALERRQQADTGFFAVLEAMRPRFGEQIRDVAGLWTAI